MSTSKKMNQATGVAIITNADLKSLKKTYTSLSNTELREHKDNFKQMLLRMRILRQTNNENFTNFNLFSEIRKMIARIETKLTTLVVKK